MRNISNNTVLGISNDLPNRDLVSKRLFNPLVHIFIFKWITGTCSDEMSLSWDEIIGLRNISLGQEEVFLILEDVMVVFRTYEPESIMGHPT